MRLCTMAKVNEQVNESDFEFGYRMGRLGICPKCVGQGTVRSGTSSQGPLYKKCDACNGDLVLDTLTPQARNVYLKNLIMRNP